jgi:hypothetical protein
MAQKNMLTYFLVALLLLTVLATAGLTIYYVRKVRSWNMLQLQTAVISRNRTLANSLLNDAIEYSKRNPAIDPILQSVGVTKRSGPFATPTPKP